MDQKIAKHIQQLNEANQSEGGKCVMYFMSRDQRVLDNDALYAAQQTALAKRLPLIVGFALYPSSKKRAREHVIFMLDGLENVAQDLASLNISFALKVGKPQQVYEKLIALYEPNAVYFDMSPLRAPRRTQSLIAQNTDVPIYVVDAHNIVPVWHLSDKQEYAARTLRPKFHRHSNEFLREPESIVKHPYSHEYKLPQADFTQVKNSINYRSAGITHRFLSGEAAARAALTDFLNTRFKDYAVSRNNPTIDGLSNLSPYLHFGQLSSRRVLIEAQLVLTADASLQESYDVLVEEIGVRKELSDNYCYYNSSYDRLAGAPEWAQKTLAKHADDHREHTYTYEQFEQAATHDAAWNAAQRQLITTGKIHGYMRMYWAKKVLEWSPDAETAIQYLCQLNDFYSLDGGDPNGYVGILWSVAGLHDRPWQERSVYGSVRSMTYSGLQRKFAIQLYIDKYQV